MDLPQAENYYLNAKPELMKDFGKIEEYLKGVLWNYFDQPKTDRLLEETRFAFEQMLPQLPYIGGEASVFTYTLIRAAWCMPLFALLEKEGLRYRDIARIGYEQKEHEVEAKSPEKRRRIREFHFSPAMKAVEIRRAKETQAGRYPGDFVSRFVPGDGEGFDFGIDFTQCAICRFFEPRGGLRYIPIFCLSDYAAYRAFGIGFRRTQTLVNGAPWCDFRFKRDWATPRGWPPEAIEEKFETVSFRS